MAGLNSISPTRPHNTAQNNPPSLPLSPDVDDAPPGPVNRGPYVIHHGVDAERLPHHKKVVDRLYYQYIYFYYDTNATRVAVENDIKLGYHAKITCSLQLCATATTTTGRG